MADFLTIDIDFTEIKNLMKQLDDKQIKESVETALKKTMLLSEAISKKAFGTSGHPKVRTGRLRSSVRGEVIKGYGLLSANVVYAAAHEYGAIIRPKTAKVLRFQIGDKVIYTRKVIIPARPTLGPSLEKAVKGFGKFLENDIRSKVK